MLKIKFCVHPFRNWYSRWRPFFFEEIGTKLLHHKPHKRQWDILWRHIYYTKKAHLTHTDKNRYLKKKIRLRKVTIGELFFHHPIQQHFNLTSIFFEPIWEENRYAIDKQKIYIKKNTRKIWPRRKSIIMRIRTKTQLWVSVLWTMFKKK